MQKHLYKTIGFLKRASVFYVAAVFISQPVAAKELREILQKSLVADPSLLEARANLAAAESATKASKAAHYPVVGLTGTQVLMQDNRDADDDLKNAIGLKGTLNLYSWGGDYCFSKPGQAKRNLLQI